MDKDEIVVEVYVSATDTLEEGLPPWYAIQKKSNTSEASYREQGMLKVAEATISFARPTAQSLVPKQVAVLREEIVRTQAAAGEKVNRLEEKIANMLAIGWEES